MGDGGLCDLFVDDSEQFRHVSDADDLFSILGTWEECMNGGGSGASAAPAAAFSPSSVGGAEATAVGARPTTNARRREGDEKKGGGGDRGAPVQKKHKVSALPSAAAENEGAAKVSHITVERNRRKQMNEHLAVLRSLMPCFYVKRGDQASIIGGVVDYIKELQQVLQSLETKKQRKAYTEQVLSPRPPPASSCSPRLPLSPQPPLLKSTPPLSPRLAVPISPRTPPMPGSPYNLRPPQGSTYVSPAMTPTHEPASYLPSLDAIAAELSIYANKQALLPPAGLLPDVRVEFAGANLMLKTVSHRAPGQAVKIIAALEGRSLEILHAKISSVNNTAVNSFTAKIGIECELSAEELVQEIQQTFT